MHPSRIAVIVAAVLAIATLGLDYSTSSLLGGVMGWEATAWTGI